MTLALLALLLFGGHAIHSFTAVMMFGVVLVGTYTSIFIAAPILIYLGVGTQRADAPDYAGEESKAERMPSQGSEGVAHSDDHGRQSRRSASSELGADRSLWQGRLRLCRHVASGLAALPARRDLGLGR